MRTWESYSCMFSHQAWGRSPSCIYTHRSRRCSQTPVHSREPRRHSDWSLEGRVEIKTERWSSVGIATLVGRTKTHSCRSFRPGWGRSPSYTCRRRTPGCWNSRVDSRGLPGRRSLFLIKMNIIAMVTGARHALHALGWRCGGVKQRRGGSRGDVSSSNCPYDCKSKLPPGNLPQLLRSSRGTERDIFQLWFDRRHWQKNMLLFHLSSVTWLPEVSPAMWPSIVHLNTSSLIILPVVTLKSITGLTGPEFYWQTY